MRSRTRRAIDTTTDLIDAASRRLAAAGVAGARLDAEVLMAEAAHVTRAELLAGACVADAATLATFDAMIVRRARREPVAYIVGHKEFFSLDFEVNRDVLIPRPETETLVTAALASLEARPEPRVLDIGTGSGAIAVTLARHLPDSRIVATDISPAALAVAKRNAERHRVSDRIEFRLADLFEVRERARVLGGFDLIASNPPYVDEASVTTLEPEIAGFEPRVALTSGADGLDFYRRIAAGARAHLEECGELMVEIGAGQAGDVARIFHDAALPVLDVINDLAGIPRVVHARLAPR